MRRTCRTAVSVWIDARRSFRQHGRSMPAGERCGRLARVTSRASSSALPRCSSRSEGRCADVVPFDGYVEEAAGSAPVWRRLPATATRCRANWPGDAEHPAGLPSRVVVAADDVIVAISDSWTREDPTTGATNSAARTQAGALRARAPFADPPDRCSNAPGPVSRERWRPRDGQDPGARAWRRP